MSSIIEKQKIAKGKVYYHQNSIAFEFSIDANGGERNLSFFPYYAVIRSIEMLGPKSALPENGDINMAMGTRSFVAGGFGGRGFNDPNNLGTLTLDDSFGDLSEKFEYLADKLYEPDERFFVRCSQSAPLQGYQECGFDNKTPSSSTNLSDGTTYSFKLAIDGGVEQEYSFTPTDGKADYTYGDLINMLNPLITGAEFSLVDGDLRCTSTVTAGKSNISLASGTTGTNLFDTAVLSDFTGFEDAVLGFNSNIRCCMVVDLYNKNSPPLKLGDYAKRKYSTILEKSVSVPANGQEKIAFDLKKSYKRIKIRQIGFEAGNIGGSSYDPDVIEDVSISLLHMINPDLQSFSLPLFKDFELKHQRTISFKQGLEISAKQILEFMATNANASNAVSVNIWMEVELFN